MRLLISLLVATTITCVLAQQEDLFKENESLDSTFEKKAFFAFKLKSEKLERRVMLAQELSKQLQQAYKNNKAVPNLAASFVPITDLQVRLAGFYYDEAEHGARMNATIAEVARSLCSSFPRYLTFDRFVLDGKMIRGRMLNGNMNEAAVTKILADNGFSYRWAAVSDVQGGAKHGFVVVKNDATYKVRVQESSQRYYSSMSINTTPQPPKEIIQIHPAAKIFLQKPLRTSVYVDTLSVCRESGGCEEVKIESCKKDKGEL